MQKLSRMPRRFELAEGNRYRSYEIRRQMIDRYIALYTIDDNAGIVWIIGFCHGSRLPRTDELPGGPVQS